jgi:uncharacterized protein YndB with AHSA1/START domain
MQHRDFQTSITVNAPASEVFRAVNNVRQWWSENIEGDTNTAGSEFNYRYQDVHRTRIKVTELIPDQKVVWHVIDNYFNFTTDKTEWNNTDIIFEIASTDGKTQLTFTHRGLVPEYECFQVCHDAWTHYIQDSLKDLIMNGKGQPTPKQNDEPPQQGQQLTSKPALSPKIFHRLLIEKPAEIVYGALTLLSLKLKN